MPPCSLGRLSGWREASRRGLRAAASLTSGFNIDRAQPFQTGSNTGGYTLTKVTFPVTGSGTPTNTQLRIESMGTNSRPAGNLGSLTLSISGGTATGTASGSGIDLAANTEYFVVLVSTDSGRNYRGTNSDSDDPGAGAGWSIGDWSRWYGGAGPTGAVAPDFRGVTSIVPWVRRDREGGHDGAVPARRW